MKYSYDDLYKRFSSAQANKQKWEHHLRECYRYLMPERDIIDRRAGGDKKREYVFDSTAEDALEDFASKLESQVVPATLNWIVLESGSEVPKESKQDVDKYLEETTKIFFDNIRSSNFSAQVHEAFLDLGISTGALIVEEGDGIQSHLNFRAINLGELHLEKSAKGIVETVFRTITVQARDIKGIWKQAKLTQELKKIIKDSPEQDITLIEGVVEDSGKYTSVLLYEGSNDILYQIPEDVSPWVVFRESTIPGEVYGRGRGMRALADIKTLNSMVKDHLKAAKFTANPIYTATDDGVINPFTVSLVPGSIMPVGSNDQVNPTLRPLPVAGDYNILQYDIRALQDTIRRTMMSKPFGNIEETPVRTATEMSIRNADQAASSASASGRIQVELIERIVAKSMSILKKAGKIAPFRVDGKEVKIKFTSPAAKQQEEQNLATIGRYIEFMQVLPPDEVKRKIKTEDFPQYIADTMGIPAKLKRTPNEEQEYVQAQQQAAQATAQAEVQGEKEIRGNGNE